MSLSRWSPNQELGLPLMGWRREAPVRQVSKPLVRATRQNDGRNYGFSVIWDPLRLRFRDFDWICRKNLAR